MAGDTEAWVLTDRFFATADTNPGRPFIVDDVFGGLRYGEAAAQVEQLALALRDLGIGHGDNVVVQLPNWTPFIIYHLALTAIGAVTINIPVTFRAREVGGILEMTDAKALVVPDRFRSFDFLMFARELASGCDALSKIFVVEGEDRQATPDLEGAGNAEVVSYTKLMSEAPQADKPREALLAMRPGLDDVTTLTFTSGTTGGLKGAVHDSRTLAAINKGLRDRYGLSAKDCIFGCSPFGHAVGFTHAVRMAVSLGAKIVLLDYWEPARALSLLHSEACTFVAAATPFLMDLVDHPELTRYDNLPNLRLFLCGGTTVPEQLVRDASARLPNALVSPLWGMSECGGVTSCPSEAPEQKFLSTDGIPCGGMEVRVVGSDMKTLAPGQEGELLVRGPMVAKGYYRLPELSRELFLADGYFRTGDQAFMDDDGYVKITGRIKDLIIRGGVNIAPVDIENVLFSHPRVRHAAVIGMPDPRLGERICAFVVPEDGETVALDDLQEWMAGAGMAKQKWPERVELVDELPMTPSGKVQKFKLRERLDQISDQSDAGG